MSEIVRKSSSCAIFVIFIVFSLFVSGCTSIKETEKTHYTEDGRIILRVSMYNSNSHPQWREYVEEHCPDVFIQWENNRNTTANILYMAEHDEMPDIISIRRFECDTSAQLRPYLADLKNLEITGSYKERYLESFAYDGKQYWLPGPGAVDGIVANADLFSQYGIEIPKDMNSFISACAQLEPHNMAVFAADCKEPWSATQLMEGFGASVLNGEGNEWVKRFEQGKTDSVNETAFADIAAIMRRLNEHGILTEEDIMSSAVDTNDMLISGRAAMVRKSSDEKFDVSASHRYTALPFYGKTESENSLCTYPVFSLAMSKNLEKDPALFEAGKKVLSVMLSEDAQKELAVTGEGLISYNNNIKLPLSDSMKSLKSLIDNEKYFIRVLNSNTFSANTLALTALIRDNADDRKFFDILNENLFKKTKTESVATSNIEASNKLDNESFCRSASVIAQVLRERTGTDGAVIDVRENPTSIYKGNYTESDVKAIVLSNKVYCGELTAEQVQSLIDTCVFSATTFQSGQVEPIIDYPAVAGIMTEMEPDGTILNINFDEAGDSSLKYKIAISSNIYKALSLQSPDIAEKFAPEDKDLQQYFLDGFKADGKLPSPKKYFSLKEKRR